MPHFEFYDQPPNTSSELVTLRAQLAGIRLAHTAIRSKCLVSKAGFDPNQPRVPAGDSDGGQWAGRNSRLRPSTAHKTRALRRKKSIISKDGQEFLVKPNPNANPDAPWYEKPEDSQVLQYDKEIRLVASETGVDPDLIRTIMYMETTHGDYGGLGPLLDTLGISKSILPMNVNVAFWGDAFGSRSDLNVPFNNIYAGAKLLKEIVAHTPSPPSVAVIASLYHDIGNTMVDDYGARAQSVYNSKLWELQK